MSPTPGLLEWRKHELCTVGLCMWTCSLHLVVLLFRRLWHLAGGWDCWVLALYGYSHLASTFLDQSAHSLMLSPLQTGTGPSIIHSPPQWAVPKTQLLVKVLILGTLSQGRIIYTVTQESNTAVKGRKPLVTWEMPQTSSHWPPFKWVSEHCELQKCLEGLISKCQ